MKKIITLFTLFFSLYGFSQNIHFIKSYGNSGYDFGKDIKQDLDTGYIATGSSSSFTSGTADAFLLKVDSLGNFKWSYNYGGQETDWGESVVVTHDSSYAIGGYTNSFGNGGFDFYAVRADKDGTPIWEKTYGGSDWDRAHSIVQLADSGFVLVGETYSFGNGNSDIYMVRTDKSGDTIWTRTYGGTESDYANAVILDDDSLVVVGGTESFGAGMTDGIILKYHIDGTLGWTKLAGMDKDDYFTSISVHPGGDYAIGGSRDYDHFSNCDCGNDFWVYRIDPTGLTTVLDTSRSGADQTGYDLVQDLVIDNNNNTYIGGSTTSWGTVDIAQGYTDAFIGKFLNNYYSAGSYIGNFGTVNNDIVHALDYTYDDGIVGVGNLNFNSTGGYNMFIVKVDQSNSTGFITVTTELTNEDITLSLEDFNSEESKLNAYPTLVSNQITVEGLSENFSYSIFSMNGSLITQKTTDHDIILVDELSEGLYILTINTDQGIKSFKFYKY